MAKKELYALVNIQLKRFVKGKNKDDRPKKAKDSNESSVTKMLSYKESRMNKSSMSVLFVPHQPLVVWKNY